MEKMDNNKIKYRSIKISFCKLKTNQGIQERVSNKLQTNHGLYSLYPLVDYKNLSSETQIENQTLKGPRNAPLKQANTLNFGLDHQIGDGKKGYKGYKEERAVIRDTRDTRDTQLEELKNKFINLLMRNGQKSKACKLFAESLKQVEEKTKTKRDELFDFFTKTKYTSLYKENKNTALYTDQKQHKQRKQENNLINKKVEQEKTTVNDLLKKSTLYQAVENVKPTLELKRVRKGGTTYQVPAIVSQKRQERLAIKWIIESAEKKKKKNKNSFSNCLVSEILDAFNKTGQPRQRRDEQLKVAEFNRAYTLYRWW